ncbi:hypothetical protein [Sinorhizobium meliloti]|uniref:hypothetical protein n=1 Tax=Rhizobium meliloti TaxID=382 RepID=UPI0013E39F17|nr:hypothetical protein [Sinorhizobium meliloti]
MRIVTELTQCATDEMGAQAGFHADDARRQLPERVGKGQSLDLATERDPPISIEANDVKDVLADVDADRRQGLRCVLSMDFHGCFSFSSRATVFAD